MTNNDSNDSEKRLAWANFVKALVVLTETDQLQWGNGSIPGDVVANLRLCDYLSTMRTFLYVSGDSEDEQAAVHVPVADVPIVRILAATVVEQRARATGRDFYEPERPLLEEYRRSGHIFVPREKGGQQ
jgi:hypothetical protein